MPEALMRGLIEPTLASRLSTMFVNQRTLIETADLEKRMAQMEEAVAASNVLAFKKRA